MTGRHDDNLAKDGCGFLTIAEVDALLEDRLPEDRRTQLDRHAARGCGPCALLLADAAVFGEVAREGPTAEERAAAEADREAVRGWLASRPATVRPSPRWRNGLVAAAAVLVVALVLVMQLRDGAMGIVVPIGGQRTYDVAIIEFSAPPVVRGEPDESTTWNQAGAAYRAGRWEEAEPLLSGLRERTDDVSAHLYLGIARLALGDDTGAVEALDAARTAASREDLPDGAVRWYRSAALLRLGHTDAAREELASLAATDLTYATEAAELLERLDDIPPGP